MCRTSGTTGIMNKPIRHNDYFDSVVTNRAFTMTYNSPSVVVNRRGNFYEDQTRIYGGVFLICVLRTRIAPTALSG